MKQSLSMAGLLAAALIGTGCAHQQPPPTTEVTEQAAAPKKPEQPLQVTQTTPVADTSSAELERALKATRVLFDFDSDRLKPASMQDLQKVGEVLKKHAPLKIRIEGNCDERGTEEYNLLLGERRATVAKQYLTALGATDAQVDTISYGALRPANPGHGEDAWAQNRRDDLQPK